MTSVLHTTAYQLGDLLGTYRHSRSASIWLGIRLALILFGGLILLAAWSTSSTGDLRFLAGIGALWLLLSILAIVQWRYKHHFCVAVYQAGLIYSRPREVIAIRWEDITAIIQQHRQSTLNGVPLGMFYTFIIQTATGRSFKFTNMVEEIALLGTHIQRATFPHLYSQALTRYQQGQIVSFGKLGINHAGLQLGQKKLAWPQLRDITLQDDSVRIRQQSKWLAWRSISITDVANIHVALPLIEEVAAHHRQYTAS
jgi:hypothetical protein